MSSDKVVVTQIRSRSGSTPRVLDTLKALGLGRIGQSRTFALNPAISGMIRATRHLVRVEKSDGK